MSPALPPTPLRVVVDGPVSAASVVSWIAPERAGSGSVTDLPAGVPLVLLLPPSRVSQHVLTLPRQPVARLRTLLPMTLEDRLLAPATEQWFSLHPLDDGQWRVQVVERAWLSGWIELLRSRGHAVEGAYALADLLPAASAWQQLPLSDGQVLLRNPDGEAACVPTALVAALAGEAPVASLALQDLAAAPLPAHDLLQDELSPRPRWQFDRKAWRRPAILAAALLLLLTALNIADWWQMSRRADALKREMRQTFAAALPGVPVVDPVLQLQSRLREAGIDTGSATGGDPLLALLRRLDQSGAMQLSSLRYGNGLLELAVNGDAAAIKARLDAAGLAPELAQGATGPVLRLQVQP